MKFDKKSFAAAVRTKREAENFSVRDLAAYLAIGPSTISRIENALGAPDVETYLTLEEWLGRPKRAVWVSCYACGGAGVVLQARAQKR